MDKSEVDALSEAEVYAQARDVARHYGGEASVRRVMQMPISNIRDFLVANGT